MFTGYAALEVLTGKSYRGKEQDVWALGILLYALVYKEKLFYNVDEILDRELRIPWIMSEGSIDLIKGMLNRDTTAHLAIEPVKEHPWCTGETQDGKMTKPLDLNVLVSRSASSAPAQARSLDNQVHFPPPLDIAYTFTIDTNAALASVPMFEPSSPIFTQAPP
jgi:serine/threonine protein kinase